MFLSMFLSNYVQVKWVICAVVGCGTVVSYSVVQCSDTAGVLTDESNVEYSLCPAYTKLVSVNSFIKIYFCDVLFYSGCYCIFKPIVGKLYAHKYRGVYNAWQ